MSKRGKRRDGIIHQIKRGKISPAPTDVKLPTIDDFRKMIEDINLVCNTEHKGPDFLETYGHLLGKSREELEQIIPDGAYNIGTGGWYIVTGKGGLIEMLLSFDENMKFHANKFLDEKIS